MRAMIITQLIPIRNEVFEVKDWLETKVILHPEKFLAATHVEVPDAPKVKANITIDNGTTYFTSMTLEEVAIAFQEAMWATPLLSENVR